MTASMMAYGLALGAMFGVSAALAEAALAMARNRHRRRWVWLVALLAVWIVSLATLVPPRESATSHAIARDTAGSALSVRLAGSGAHVRLRRHATTILNDPRINRALAGLWAASSAALLLCVLFASSSLRRRASLLPQRLLCGAPVRITDGLGPAVLGAWRPMLLIPRAVLGLPVTQQQVVVQHEMSHAKARDPLLLSIAIAAVIAAPWNPFLWWMYRRLRLAIEIDCDARILAAGTTPSAYGETLLALSRRGRRAPWAAAALIGRASQLERRLRIMLHPRKPFSLPIIISIWIGAASIALAAVTTEGPRNGNTPSLSKAPPPEMRAGQLPWYVESIEALLGKQYPQLKTEKLAGTPVLTILFRHDRTVSGSYLEVVPEVAERFNAQPRRFERLGAVLSEFDFITVQGMATRANEIVVVLGEQRDPAQPRASVLTPDTAEVDHQIVARHFPDALDGRARRNESLWAMFEHGGALVRAGRDAIPTQDLAAALEARWAGVRISSLITTPILDDAKTPIRAADGGELKLHSIWLAEGSALPPQ